MGRTFVNSTYLWFASGGTNRGFSTTWIDPLESLAEGVLVSVRDAMDSMFFQDRRLVQMIDDFQADGVVYHPIKSCRTVSTGLADSDGVIMIDKRDIPSLFIESDMMDRRVVSEAQLKNRIDAFFEGLASRRQQAAAPAPRSGGGDEPMAYAAGVDVGVDADQGSHHRRGPDGSSAGRSSTRAPTSSRPPRTAFDVEALAEGGIDDEEVEYVIGTGYGRYRVTFGNTQVTEISCHGRGAVHMFPEHAHRGRHGGAGHQGDQRQPPNRRDHRLLHERQVRGRDGTVPRRRIAALDIPLDELGKTAAQRRGRSRSARPAPSLPSPRCSPGWARARRSRNGQGARRASREAPQHQR